MTERYRILVVDDQEVNLRLFGARLQGLFEVETWQGAREALLSLEARPDAELPHLIILDALMPELDGFSFLQIVKEALRLQSISVLMVTSLADSDSRARALTLGADDFLSRPVNGHELLSRAKSLAELGWLRRQTRTFGSLREGGLPQAGQSEVFLVDASPSHTRLLEGQLKNAGYAVRPFGSGEAALDALENSRPDLFLIDVQLPGMSGFEVCEDLKRHSSLSHLPVILMTQAGEGQARIRGWEVDADDFLSKPIDPFELLARVRSLVRKKRQVEALNRSYDQLLDYSSRDPLTDIYNRAYLEQALGRELALSQRDGMPFSLLMLDLDYFKRVNDTYGHFVGDQVLRRFAKLLHNQLRTVDVAARYGGEEFAAILHNTGAAAGQGVAERVRRAVSGFDWQVVGVNHAVTVSIGVANYPEHSFDLKELMMKADEALYTAKLGGRDRVALASESS